MNLLHVLDHLTVTLGRPVVVFFTATFDLFKLVYISSRSALFFRAQSLRSVFSVVASQVYFTGFQALPLISTIALATGVIVILQSTLQLSVVGSSAMLGQVLVGVLVRELGPLVTALIVIARSGTAVSSEIGNMRANREIEALESLGIDPMSYIVFPRILGGVVSVLCLAFYFNIISLLGGFAVSRLLNDMPMSYFIDAVATAISGSDVMIFFLKNTFSGLIIFVVACSQGLSVQQSLHEVPQATTRAVVRSISYVICFNLVVTAFFYLQSLVAMGLVHL
jgi:phospholipid/cholesterol/gamma-HCH transport system permease protein